MHHTWQKCLAILLCAVLLTAFVPCVCAAESLPVVFVAGYTSSRLYLYPGTPEEKRVWKQPVGEKVKEAIQKEMPGVALDAVLAAAGRYDELFDALEPYADEIMEPLRMNDDGSSKYPVETYPHSVETTRLDQLQAIGYYPDHDSLVALGKAAGAKNVYCCTLDWRLGQVDNAAVLDAYIRDVLRVSGKDKVDLMGVSFGGQVVGSYLSLYGGSHVRRVVMQCPALDGSSIVPQLLSGAPLSIAWQDFAELYRAYQKEEADYALLAASVDPAVLSRFIRAFVDRFMVDFFVNFGSVWDLVPAKDYAALRDRLLRDGKHDEMIRKSDLYHNEISANMTETLRQLSAQGVQIAIVAGYGYALTVDNGANSDGVIDLASMTGAECASPGKTLGGKRAVGRSVSPDGVIDVSGAYLPDRTWFVQGLLHSMGANEEKVNALMCTLLLTDTIRDVHSSPEFPQFMASENVCRGVYCAFSTCGEGYCTPYSTVLRITNLSEKTAITVDGIDVRGANLKCSFTRGVTLEPGESMDAAVTGKLPADEAAFRVTVRYVQIKENYDIGKSRTQYFRFVSEPDDEILTQDVAGADTIPDAPASLSGAVTFRVLLARVLAELYACAVAARNTFVSPLLRVLLRFA